VVLPAMTRSCSAGTCMALLFQFWRGAVSTTINGRPEAIDLDQAGPSRLGGREMLSSMEEVCNLLYSTGYQKTAYVGAFGRFLINLVRFCRTI
jgi:hypothetical protein